MGLSSCRSTTYVKSVISAKRYTDAGQITACRLAPEADRQVGEGMCIVEAMRHLQCDWYDNV